MDKIENGISRRALLSAAGTAAAAFSGGMLLGATPVSAGIPDDRGACFNVLHFGAIGDGITDDTDAIQAAIRAAERVGGVLEFPSVTGSYRVGDLIISRPVVLRGIGSSVTLTALPETRYLFAVRSGTVRITGFTVDMSLASDKAVVCYLDTSFASLSHIYVERLTVNQAGCFLCDADHDTQLIVHLHVSQVSCRVNRRTSIMLKDAFAYIYFTNVNIDNVPVVAAGKNVTFPGIVVQHAQGLHFEKCDVTGGNGMPNAHGFHLLNCEAVHFNTCMADYVGGNGFRFENVWYLYLVATVASLCSQNGVYMKGCRFVNGTNVTTAGRSKMPDPPPDAHGISAHDSADLVFSTVSSRFNTGDGIRLANCQQTSWTALHLFDNDGMGLREAEGQDRHQGGNILSGIVVKSNRSGNYALFSNKTHVSQAVIDSGELRMADQGPFSC